MCNRNCNHCGFINSIKYDDERRKDNYNDRQYYRRMMGQYPEWSEDWIYHHNKLK
jgi:hypothetical protein